MEEQEERKQAGGGRAGGRAGNAPDHSALGSAFFSGRRSGSTSPVFFRKRTFLPSTTLQATTGQRGGR